MEHAVNRLKIMIPAHRRQVPHQGRTTGFGDQVQTAAAKLNTGFFVRAVSRDQLVLTVHAHPAQLGRSIHGQIPLPA